MGKKKVRVTRKITIGDITSNAVAELVSMEPKRS